jgi:group I intron endonuclease
MKITGIYRILNLNTEESYIGSAKDILQRWRDHKKRLRKGNHHSQKLQNSWQKHGEDVWLWLIIEICTVAELVTKEQWYMDQFDAFGRGYNMTPKAASTLGIPCSEATKLKIGYANCHRVWTGQSLANLKAAMKGRKAWNKGIPFPEEVKIKLRESAPARKSLEHRKHIGDSHRGIPKKPESVEKQRNSLMGHKQSEETKARRRATWEIKRRRGDRPRKSRITYKRTPEHAAKIAKANRHRNGWQSDPEIRVKNSEGQLRLRKKPQTPIPTSSKNRLGRTD